MVKIDYTKGYLKDHVIGCISVSDSTCKFFSFTVSFFPFMKKSSIIHEMMKLHLFIQDATLVTSCCHLLQFAIDVPFGPNTMILFEHAHTNQCEFMAP